MFFQANFHRRKRWMIFSSKRHLSTKRYPSTKDSCCPHLVSLCKTAPSYLWPYPHHWATPEEGATAMVSMSPTGIKALSDKPSLLLNLCQNVKTSQKHRDTKGSEAPVGNDWTRETGKWLFKSETSRKPWLRWYSDLPWENSTSLWGIVLQEAWCAWLTRWHN